MKPKPQPFLGQSKSSHQEHKAGWTAVMQGFLGQDIPPRGPWRGAAREKGEESPEREQIEQPTHICPETGRVSVCPAPPPARMGGGQEGGCTHSRFHPSTGTKLWLSILPPTSGNLAWPMPSAFYTHAAQHCAIKLVLQEWRI